MDTISYILLSIITLLVMATVMTRSLLRAAIGLALVSAVLSVIMFRMGAQLAAMFELSVCVGLIPVIFITVISLTKPLTKEEVKSQAMEKLNRFWMLPVLLIVVAVSMLAVNIKLDIPAAKVSPISDVRVMIWSVRQIDLIGQVAVLLAGAFAILMLFKGKKQ
jgi:NADH-quinone oxidoreductase subunit J